MTRTLALAALSLLSSACASATLVRRDAHGGRVQLSGSFVPAVSQAKVLMAEQCNGRFQAVEHPDQLEFRCRDDDGPLDDALAGL